MDNEIVKNEQLGSLAKISEDDILGFLDLYGYKDLLPDEKKQFVKVCAMNSLNPFKREAHISSYGTGKYRQFAIITGYEVYIKRAELSGRLGGWNVETSMCKTVKTDVKGKLTEIDDLQATITIHRKDFDKPFTHSVKFSEYAQKTKDGNVTKFWLKAESQIKKVATSQGFRLCFNEILGGLPYGDQETNTIQQREQTNYIEDTTAEDVTNQKEIEAPKKEILSGEKLAEIIEGVQNFEIGKQSAQQIVFAYEYTKEQGKALNNAFTFEDSTILEAVEMITAEKFTIEHFAQFFTKKQFESLEAEIAMTTDI